MCLLKNFVRVKCIFILVVFLLFTNANSQTYQWSTTRGGWLSQGRCNLISSKIKMKIHPFHIDIEEEAEIAPTGDVVSGDNKTLEIVGNFNLTKGSLIRSMLIWWNDTIILKAKLRDRLEADSAYEDVVDRENLITARKDPALIEYLGNDQYRIKLYPFTINKSRKVRILYSICNITSSKEFLYNIKFIFVGSYT